jgi:hypothetical protein
MTDFLLYLEGELGRNLLQTKRAVLIGLVGYMVVLHSSDSEPVVTPQNE